MGLIQLTDATVLVNNEAIAIIPNTLKYTEGFGEQTVRAMSVGGGSVEPIYSNNVEDNLSDCMFEIPTTSEGIAQAKDWKTRTNTNVVQIAGSTPQGQVTRTVTQAALTNNYEVGIGSETSIPLEFKGNAAI